VLARVAPGTSDTWLSAAGTAPYRNGERLNVKAGPDTSATVLAGPLLEARGPSLQPRTDVAITTRLVGVALIVLLIACANVANLLLARSITRRREIAVRLALGMSRRRLVAQLLVEGVTLALAAGIVAVLVGEWGGAALQRGVLSSVEAGGASLHIRLISATLGAALFTGVLASLIPALRASRPDLTGALKAGARASNAEHSRLRSTLVIVQGALSVVLLAGAGLFVRSLDRVRHIDLGFDANRLLYATATFVNPEGHYVERAARHLPDIYRGLRDVSARIQQIPGVEHTALATSSPLGGYGMVGLHLANGVPAPRLDNLDAALLAVTPSYFATTGLELVRGRLIDDGDRAGAEPVIVVNETTARTYWPSREAIGQCIYLRSVSTPVCSRVVGIVRDSHFDEVVETPHVALFVPVGPIVNAFTANPSFIIVRVAPSAIARVSAELRRVLHETFPTADLPVVQHVSARVENQLRPWKLGASIFTAFGVLSLVVAATGVYSVIAYSVSLRTHEIGVRMALGARYQQVIALVLTQGMRMTLVGLSVGVALALVLGRFVASMLYGTSPHDPLALTLAVGSLVVVTLLACIVPAWHAARTDPAVALRVE
jgi:predicted permease